MLIEFSPPGVQSKFEPSTSKQEQNSLLPLPTLVPSAPPSIPSLITKIARKIVLSSGILKISVTKPPTFVHKDNIVDDTIFSAPSTFVLESANVLTPNLSLSLVQVSISLANYFLFSLQ
jgi:hypothetical protein